MKGKNSPLNICPLLYEDLITRGVDVCAEDSFGKTPLHYAAESQFSFLINKVISTF